MFDSVHCYRLTSRCLCLKLEVPMIWKFLSNKVGIIQTQIISISNVKELNTVRRTSKWVKDNPRHAEGTAHTQRALPTPTRCLVRLTGRALGWQQTGKNPCSSWACKPPRDHCVSLCSQFNSDGSLLLSPTFTCIGCLSHYKGSGTLLVLDSVPFLLYMVFPVGTSVSGNTLITGSLSYNNAVEPAFGVCAGNWG